MNKKRILPVLCFVILIMFTTACTSKNIDKNLEQSKSYYTFTDSSDRIINLKSKPEKVAVLFSSLGEAWQNAGGEIFITVGETIERGLVSENIRIVDSGAGKTIDNEALIKFKPDFVIGSADIPAHQKTVTIMENVDIPCALFRMDTFEDYLRCLEVFTDITGEKENYTLYGENVKKEIENILSSSLENKDKILFIRCGSSLSSAKAKKSQDNFAAKIISDFGCINIADKAEILLDTISAEEILNEDPDYIFVSLMGNEANSMAFVNELLKQEEFSSLSAVKNQKVVFLPKELFHFKPCGRWAESYKYIYDILNEK